MYGRRTRRPTYRKAYKGRKKSRYTRAATRYNGRRALAKVPIFRPRWKTVTPQKMLVRFKYNDTGFDGSLSSGNIYMHHHVFRGNSPYDPDYTGVGISPYGWDEYRALYENYVCKASSIKIYYFARVEDDATEIPKINVRVFPHRDAGISINDPGQWSQFRNARAKCITGDSDSDKLHIKNYSSIKVHYPDMTPKDNNFAATMTANPNFQWFWHVVFEDYNWGIDVTIYYDVKITYYTILTRSPELVAT